ncbi:MAG: hypothetical protein F4Y82_02145 [Cenarchaeum sp. SB0665_bin_23]|nr:hypothetical protein [Cenarchaeum sp. SB0664_bin_35]MXY60903.1 hypothetical protein [Cenarchaeum sp. SB0665_bin_23]MXZ92913.1 hypothetical protein [Cenarchaeum sp. SB0666_bin_15]MYB47281.1 hypothetical protein [Cenarchaeum sp. SB0662_bin_33]MYC79652.1 hypothetical protein [Cenarchaeum sp. SB0661_bin_35]MYD58505.1 hypothetical protein [Cenarchaeum sp. SB0678_bin_8]MYG33076.1 hypothetical protein [Cenarchaeum sp. SB0677_bin_16]MYI52305.1 hypothetical protein [Cenarchaeum sp. SB0673_bin_9]M
MWWGYTRRTPRKVKGGIRLQSTRGESAQSWWGKSWNQTLYKYIEEGRLGRGRSYARRGMVRFIEIKQGVARGVVQGSMRSPYICTIKVRQLNREAWGRVADELVKKPGVIAKMMAGQMPKELEDIFGSVGLSLFPDHMESDCDCYDWGNPCKHAAAVYLILAQELDRDPMLIMRLRGMDQKNLLGMMGVDPVWDTAHNTGESVLAPSVSDPEPIPLDAGTFWGRAGSSILPVTPAEVPTVSAVLPRKLGVFPFWRGEETFIDALDAVYKDASEKGMEYFLGDDDGSSPATK